MPCLLECRKGMDLAFEWRAFPDATALPKGCRLRVVIACPRLSLTKDETTSRNPPIVKNVFLDVFMQFVLNVAQSVLIVV